MGENPARAVFSLTSINLRGRSNAPPPPAVRGLSYPATGWGGGDVKRPHFFRRVINPVWRGAAAPNFV